MPSDVPGIGSSGIGSTGLGRGRPINPAASGAAPPSVDGIVPGRAVVRIEAPKGSTETLANPIGRSGLDLLDVLEASDSLVLRRAPLPVALEMGLEQARGALIRQQPGDALAALDAVWEGASRTEEGWYLRSGALLVLGLPGEGERVAQSGIDARPNSNALRFVQSLARLAVGDLAGARTALQGALQRLPADPLLLVQQAVLLATQGDGAGADAAMQSAARRVAEDHPAIVFGRDAVKNAKRAVTAELARSGSVRAVAGEVAPNPGGTDDVMVQDLFGDARSVAGMSRGAPAREENPLHALTAATSGDGTAHHDPVTDAVRRLGVRLVNADGADVAREIRTLLRALSSGGTLATAGVSSQAHSARSLLSIVASVLLDEQSDAPPAKRALVSAVIGALRGDHPEDVLRAMRRPTSVVNEPFGAMLRAMVEGALSNRPGAATDGVPRGERARDGAQQQPQQESALPSAGAARSQPHVVRDAPAVQDDAAGIDVPVRLGLRLIDETPAMRAAVVDLPAHARGEGSRAREGVEFRPASGDPHAGAGVAYSHGATNAETLGFGWGAAGAAAAAGGAVAAARTGGFGADAYESSEQPASDSSRFDVRIAAVTCIAIAGLAAMLGYTSVAVSFGIGAAWLALRRSTRRDSRTHATHSAPTTRQARQADATVASVSPVADERDGGR